MRADVARHESGLTGSGMNIMLYEDWVISDIDDFRDIINPGNIKNVYENNLYDVETGRSAVPFVTQPNATGHHTNIMAASMQAYARNANIFAVAQGMANIEWALLNCRIKIISHSLHGSPRDGYSNNSWAKWFDALVVSANVTVVGSTGNSTNQYPQVGSYCAICGGCYNTIGAGAYHTKGDSDNDIMHDKFRYNPIVCNPGSFDNGDPLSFPDVNDYRHYGNGSGDQVCYKPDMVVAAPHTSAAAASLSGIIYLMIQFKPSLAARPELIKAILMASCHRKVKPAFVDGGSQEEMTDGLTQRQGTGAIDVYRALSIVAQGKYCTYVTPSHYNHISITLKSPANGNNINVSLAWLSYTHYSIVSTEKFELCVCGANGNVLGESTKKHANKQMVYLPLSSVGNQFTIRVQRKNTYGHSPDGRFAFAWSTEETAGFLNEKFTFFERLKCLLSDSRNLLIAIIRKIKLLLNK